MPNVGGRNQFQATELKKTGLVILELSYRSCVPQIQPIQPRELFIDYIGRCGANDGRPVIEESHRAVGVQRDSKKPIQPRELFIDYIGRCGAMKRDLEKKDKARWPVEK